MTDAAVRKGSPGSKLPARRCRFCGCSIDHMAPTARYCGDSHRLKALRLRKKCIEELSSADRDGGFIRVPVSQINALGEELGLNPMDEGDEILTGELLVMAYHDRGLKISALEAELRKLKAQA